MHKRTSSRPLSDSAGAISSQRHEPKTKTATYGRRLRKQKNRSPKLSLTCHGIAYTSCLNRKDKDHYARLCFHP